MTHCCTHACNEGRDCPHRKTPVYDAEFFEPSSKRPRGLGLGWHVALLFVLLTALFVGLLGIWLT